MSFFGSEWADDEDHGPLSHWLEDSNNEVSIFSHWKEDEDEDSYEGIMARHYRKKYKEEGIGIDDILKPNLE